MFDTLSSLAVPVVIGVAGLIMLFGKKDYFAAFTEGATQGFKTAVGLLPILVGLSVAVTMLTESGAVGLLCSYAGPFLTKLGIPAELLPLLLTRPVSGSASIATYTSLLDQYGADSFAGLCASVIMGSSDTLVYVISIYFASVGIKNTRHAFLSAVIVMLFSVFFACFICRLYFGI